MNIPFNKPHMTGKELWYIAQAHHGGQLSGDGPFTKKCNTWLERRTSAKKAMLTHSCTAALEMSAMLAEVGPGDEVITAACGFPTTVSPIIQYGARPVFVDVTLFNQTTPEKN